MVATLATGAELASFLGLVYADLSVADQARLTRRMELATGRVQDAIGRSLLTQTGTVTIDVDPCEFDPHLPLPVLAPRSLTEVRVDGTVYADVVLRNFMLWRVGGWGINADAPARVEADLTWGYAAGSQSLVTATGVALAYAAAGWDAPDGAVASEEIDDYRVAYARSSGTDRMELADSTVEMLRSTYGVTAYSTGGR